VAEEIERATRTPQRDLGDGVRHPVEVEPVPDRG
jgi:hypothetical protein